MTITRQSVSEWSTSDYPSADVGNLPNCQWVEFDICYEQVMDLLNEKMSDLESLLVNVLECEVLYQVNLFYISICLGAQCQNACALLGISSFYYVIYYHNEFAHVTQANSD